MEICEENPIARVEKCLSNPKSKYRPLPLDTVELQKLGKKFILLLESMVTSNATKQRSSLYKQYVCIYTICDINIHSIAFIHLQK